MNRALLITGAPGAGKSTLLGRLTTRLEIASLTHGAVEADELARGLPFAEIGEWAPRLALVCADMRRAGRDLLIVVATVETEEQLDRVRTAIAAERLSVVCLSAPADLLAARVLAREPADWPGRDWLISHAAELAEEIPALAGIDVVVASFGRSPEEIADEVWARCLAPLTR